MMTQSMTAKERLLAALRGQEIDRPTWSPFLAYWWEEHPELSNSMSMLEFLDGIGADPLIRGGGLAWDIAFKDTQTREVVRGNKRYNTWETPVGTLEMEHSYSKAGNTWFITKHPIEDAEQLKILMWMYERAVVTYNTNADEAVREAGDRGLIVPLVGSEGKTCFQSFVEKWIGTENLAYMALDEPEALEECLQVMWRASEKTIDHSVNSLADAFIFWEDTSTTNINPAMFRRFVMPEITMWGNKIHAAGKMLLHHACGHLRGLLPLMSELPIDAIESISPPPTGNIDLPEAFGMIREDIALIGGIEPVFYTGCTDEELTRRIDYLLSKCAGRRLMLANSDSCPPNVTQHQLKLPADYLAGKK